MQRLFLNPVFDKFSDVVQAFTAHINLELMR
jgi:hypothetical protein